MNGAALHPIMCVSTKYLPYDDLHPLRLVCRLWKDTIDNYNICEFPRLINHSVKFIGAKFVVKAIFNGNHYYLVYHTKDPNDAGYILDVQYTHEMIIYDSQMNRVTRLTKEGGYKDWCDYNRKGTPECFAVIFKYIRRYQIPRLPFFGNTDNISSTMYYDVIDKKSEIKRYKKVRISRDDRYGYKNKRVSRPILESLTSFIKIHSNVFLLTNDFGDIILVFGKLWRQ